MKEKNIKYYLFLTAIFCSFVIGLAIYSNVNELKNNHIAHLENITTYLEESIEGAEWVCIAEACVDFAEGDDWIVANCRPEGENKTLVCKIKATDGNTYNAPLSIINLSNVRSCKEYACAAEVYVRGRTEINKKEV